MKIVRWRPYGDLLSMHDRIHRFFEDAVNNIDRNEEPMASWYPLTDIYETKDDYIFKLEVPGLTKDDINIEFNGNILSVKGEKKEEKEVKKDNFFRVESYSGKFSRTFTLPRQVDAEKISAVMKNGILELRIAKVEEKKTKSISISVK